LLRPIKTNWEVRENNGGEISWSHFHPSTHIVQVPFYLTLLHHDSWHCISSVLNFWCCELLNSVS